MIPKSKKYSSPLSQPDIATLVRKIREGNRRSLSKAITLIESDLEATIAQKNTLFQSLGSPPNETISIAVTGPPGAGKSSFIESIGSLLVKHGKKIAVLSVDPSSSLTHGSILGDKTRMPFLSKHELAFIRPTPNSGSMGGVHPTTIETIQLCAHAGFDYVFVETVGVGQSEIEVKQVVDMVSVIIQPGSGDDVQGIKKGLNEISDIFIVNKADGEQLQLARDAKSTVLGVQRIQQSQTAPVVLHSAFDDDMREQCLRQLIDRYHELKNSDEIKRRRTAQKKYWLMKRVEQNFLKKMTSLPEYSKIQAHYLDEVLSGKINIHAASNTIVDEVLKRIKRS